MTQDLCDHDKEISRNKAFMPTGSNIKGALYEKENQG